MNRKLSKQHADVQDSFDTFIAATEKIVLEEGRTPSKIQECKIRALETKNALRIFIKYLDEINLSR